MTESTAAGPPIPEPSPAGATDRSDPLVLGVLLGDGIGPEIVPAAVSATAAALAAAGAPTPIWVDLPVGLAAIARYGSPLPDRTVERLETLDGWLLGPHDSAAYPEPHNTALNPSGAIRKAFDLFANIRPARSLRGVPARSLGTDLVVVRENTQGFYADRNTYAGSGEFMPTAEVAVAMAVFTRPAVERIARVAFELARTRRNRVTIVHKANVLPLTFGMFRDICYEVAADYPEVDVDDHHIDAMTVHLVRGAAEFDVIVTENMMGDILSDLTGELAGSLGMAPSINHSLDRAMAQATHGSAPDIAGTNLANPVAMMLSAAMLLRWLGERRRSPVIAQAASRLEGAVETVVAGGIVTPDAGGGATTSEVANAVIEAISGPRSGTGP